MLYLIEHYLSDGRLIKIVGEEEAQYVPLIKQPGVTEGYDVIVDEAKTSANQKEATWAYLQQILPVIGKMLPPATWLALLKYSPLPTSAQKDIQDSIKQSQAQPDPEQAARDAELKLQQDKAAADIANHQKMTDAKIAGMQAEAATKREIALQDAQQEAFATAFTAPPVVGPDGVPVQSGDPMEAGAHAAGLVMSVIGEMRRDMAKLADAFNASKQFADAVNVPKQLIRDPQTGDIIGIAPMRAG